MLANAAPTQRLTPPPNGIQATGLALAAHVPVRVERRRVREALFRVVGQLDADDDVGALRNDPVAQPDSRLRAPCRAVENRPGALHFPDRGLPQFGSAGVGFLSQPRQQLGMAAQPLQRPGHRSSGCLVTGAEQGQQLVGDVLIRDRLAVFVAGLQQQRKHVAALFRWRGRPAPRRSAKSMTASKRRRCFMIAAPTDSTDPGPPHDRRAHH